MHGAALSSFVFNSNTVIKLIELFHPGYVIDMYRNRANAVGGTWGGVSGKITKKLGLKPRPSRTALCYHFNVTISHVKCSSENLRLKENQISTQQ
jgi:hypothetical protein